MSYLLFSNVLRYAVGYVTLVLAVIGLGLTVFGFVFLFQLSSSEYLLTDIKTGITAPQLIIIIFGILLLTAALIGLWGAIQLNRFKLTCSAIYLLVIFGFQFACGIYLKYHNEDMGRLVKRGVNKYFANVFDTPRYEEVYHNLEKFFPCCESSANYSLSNPPYPASCCLTNNTSCEDASELRQGLCKTGMELSQTARWRQLATTTFCFEVLGFVGIALDLILIFTPSRD